MASTLPIVILSLFTGAMYLKTQTRVAQDYEQKRLVALASSLASAVEFALITGNINQMNQITASVRKLPYIKEIRIYDSSHLVYSGAVASTLITDRDKQNNIFTDYFGQLTKIFRSYPDSYEVSQPIWLTDMSSVEDSLYDVDKLIKTDTRQTRLGTLELVINLYPFFKEQDQWLINVLKIGIIIIGVFCLLAFRFAKTITYPITNVTTSILSLANGDYFSPDKHRYKGEIGELVNGINHLSYQLRENERIKQDSINEATNQLQNTMQDLKNTNDELDISIGQANTANMFKTRFLANMSHEIRTPMNSIVGNISLLENTHLESEQQKYIHNIKYSTDSMLKLIDEILDISAIESGNWTISHDHVNLNVLITEIHSEISSLAIQKGLEFYVINMLPIEKSHVITDNKRLRQVLINLLGNAIKFTHEGHVYCKISFDNILDSYCFTISDTGIGISKNNQRDIFQPFKQVDMLSSRKYSGNGLGLHICAEIVEKLAGTLLVESEINSGTSMHIQIPLSVNYNDLATSPTQFQKKKIHLYYLDLYAPMKNEMLSLLESIDIDIVSKRNIDHSFDDLPVLVNLPAVVDIEEIGLLLHEFRFGTGKVVAISNYLSEVDRIKLHKIGVSQIVARSPNPLVLRDGLLEAIYQENSMSFPLTENESSTSLSVPPCANVLILDDNAINLELMKNYMLILQQNSQLVTSSEEAIECLQRERYSYIFLDLHVPSMDGFAIASYIRSNYTLNSDVVLIALTADVYDATEKQALEVGFDVFMKKPVTLDQIRELLLQNKFDERVEFNSSTNCPSDEVDSTNSSAARNICVDRCATMLQIDKTLARSIMKKYGASLAIEINRLKEAIDQIDNNAIYEIMHSLKGASAICAIDTLVTQISLYEVQRDDHNWNRTNSNANELIDSLSGIEHECEQL